MRGFSVYSSHDRILLIFTQEGRNCSRIVSNVDGHALRESVTDALRFWEPRRLIYNVVLTIVVLAHFGIHYSTAKANLSVNFGLGVFLLAVLANVAYCAAYLPDVFAQMSGFRETWRKYRWVLFVIGTIFAGILTHFFSYALFGGGGAGNG